MNQSLSSGAGYVDVENRIRTIVARLAMGANPGALPRDADVFRSLGIASSAALDLLLSMEEELGVSIPDAAFNEARTIDALVGLVQGGRS